MYRQSNANGAVSSDDDDDDNNDGPTTKKLRPQSPDYGNETTSTTKKSYTMWADVSADQELALSSDRLRVKNPGTVGETRVYRGAESYNRPTEDPAAYWRGGNARKEGSPKPADSRADNDTFMPVDAADSDLFGGTSAADLTEVEQFGVLQSDKPAAKMRRVPFYNRGQLHTATGSGGRGNASRGGPSGRGNVSRGRGGPSGWKRVHNNSNTTQAYSFERLKSVVIPAGLGKTELAKKIAEALGETQPDVLNSIINNVDETTALRLFNETRDVEANGGMKVQDGSRRRTPGGVFIMLFKCDMEIPPQVKDTVFNAQKELNRKTLQAKRQDGNKFAASLQALNELKQKTTNTD